MDEQKPGSGQSDGLKSIGEGLKAVFGGMFDPQQAAAITPSDTAKVTLKYSEETEYIYDEADLVPDDLPTVREAYEEYSGSLGLDPNRSCTYRKNGVVVDANARIEMGAVYVASVVRSTKG